MPDRKTSVANFWETQLSAPMNATDTICHVVSTSGITSPALLVIDGENPELREVVLFDGTFTSIHFRTTSVSNRYQAGSAATSGLSHPVGASVRSVPLAQHVIDLNDRVDAAVSAAQDAVAVVAADVVEVDDRVDTVNARVDNVEAAVDAPTANVALAASVGGDPLTPGTSEVTLVNGGSSAFGWPAVYIMVTASFRAQSSDNTSGTPYRLQYWFDFTPSQGSPFTTSKWEVRVGSGVDSTIVLKPIYARKFTAPGASVQARLRCQVVPTSGFTGVEAEVYEATMVTQAFKVQP